MKICTKCETYKSTSRKKLSRLHEDSQRKKLRFCDPSTANYRFINKMELTKRLNNAQKEKQQSIQRAMRLTLSSNNQTVSEAAKTSKEQHCTLRCIVENAELEFDEKNSTVAIMATTKSINFKYQVSVSHFQLLTRK